MLIFPLINVPWCLRELLHLSVRTGLWEFPKNRSVHWNIHSMLQLCKPYLQLVGRAAHNGFLVSHGNKFQSLIHWVHP